MNKTNMISKYCFSLSLLTTCCCVQAEFPTLEELNSYLESQKIANPSNIGEKQPIQEESETEQPKGILSIQYNAQGEPEKIESNNISLYDLLQNYEKTTLEDKRNCDPVIKKISKDKFATDKPGEIFVKISRPLPRETLQKRDISNDEINNLMQNREVREITFESSVDGFFPEQAEQWKGYLKDENEKQLLKYIDGWVEKLPLLKKFRCEGKAYFPWWKEGFCTSLNISYKVSDPEKVKNFHQNLKKIFRELIQYKNGKEKIILMLACDQSTPEEHRLLIVPENDYAYDETANAILIPDTQHINLCSLSHEIGHYLENVFGIDKNEPIQNVDDFYQIPFAKSLFILPDQQEGKVKIPVRIYHDLLALPWNLKIHGNGLKEYSIRNLYFHIQINLYWYTIAEVTNTIGLYILRDDQQKPYIGINRLSDINHGEYIFLGHMSETKKGLIESICKDLKEDNNLTKNEKEDCINDLKSIVEKCEIKKPSEASVKLLLKLHERTYEPEKILYFSQLTTGEITKDELLPKIKLLPKE